jgi:hypothetical protein
VSAANAAKVAQQLQDGGVESWLMDAVERLARTKDRSLDPFFLSVGEVSLLAGTQTTCRCLMSLAIPAGARIQNQWSSVALGDD